MAKKSIVWTQTAIKQRREILKYWTTRNKSTAYAEKLIGLIKERVSLISENPLAGKETSHFDTREAAMGNFSIYYKVTNGKIFITAFWDNRQSPKKLIKIFKSK
ncbi:type II toxin-antitoxin system RelE/ParE family toxin [Flavobacterium caeni]|uniref:type II toxin-antitoxin system RelE/ParE family toxin n=1 Tax=Flavobacterium caeni TaxID=490189 RepID=UPI000B871075|nr:type II toxin-antitoxin system RelE/ParE family toxin [Flavobacterium caeni]